MADNFEFKNNFADYFKSFGSDWKTPNVDLNQVFALQRRNLEAFSTATQILIEGTQAIGRRQTELLRDYTEQFLAAGKDIMTTGAPETNASRQSAFTKSMYENAVSGAREISEMASKSSFEAFDTLNKRAAETLEELASVGKKAA